MIVEITSWAPTIALSSPAMPAHAAPASVAATIVSTTCSSLGMSVNEEPTHTATYEPTRYWPWPPMLNSPQRKAKATASPVRISGVVRISVCCRFSAAVARSSPVTQGKNQFSPVPLKIAL